MTDRVGIYIHVPFCRSKCYYCDFCSQIGSDDETRKAYVDAACREIGEMATSIRERGDKVPSADTVFFGGGTPSLLSAWQFERLISAVNDSFGIADGAEITAEINPKTADLKKLSDMRALGINRLSIGMQSVHDNELRALGRIHRSAYFEKCFCDARRAGFDNISADLMYGIPEQTEKSFSQSVEALCNMSPEHISAYCLTVEEGTNFYHRRDSLILPDEDAISNMYCKMSNILADSGYNKYEISNFARHGRESRHNLKYWRYDDYIGIGPAAHSFFGGVRQSHSRDIESYIRGENIIDSSDKIDFDEAVNEYVMLAMRLSDGVDIAKFEERFNVDFNRKFGKKFLKFFPVYIYLDENNCRFTDKGMFVSNHILSEVLDF